MKKVLFKLSIIVILFISLPSINYADEELYDDDLLSSEILNTLSSSFESSNFPVINARHAIVFDRSSMKILYGKKENEICKMASTTKIMTAIVVIENANLSDTVIISKKAANTGGSRLGLSANDKITVENLLYGLMLKSGNDAAVALAEHVGRKY